MEVLGRFIVVVFLISIFASEYVVSEPFTDFEKKFKRTLSPLEVNPGCDDSWCKNDSFTGGVLTHTVAKGDKDELHHIFCTVGAPTFMISRTKLDTHLKVDYDILRNPNRSEALNYTNPPQHSFGMIFPNIYEYDDFNDTANMSNYATNSSANIKHVLTNLKWTVRKENGHHKYRNITLTASGTNFSHSSLFKDETSSVSFMVRYDTEDGRLLDRPHMEYTANSSMVTISMTNLSSNFPNSRFAVEMVMFSTENSSVDPAQQWNATQVTLSTSLDDEYSPGVFQMRNWLANDKKPRDSAWGYAQWKPVVYTKRTRLNADLSHANSYPNLAKDKDYIVNHTLPYRGLFLFYFGNDDTKDISLNATNVSFGLTKDKFYKNTDYLVWTMAMGMGPPPEDDVSILVILVISIGLGIPLILMIFSAVFVCVKNFRKRQMSSGYMSINDE